MVVPLWQEVYDSLVERAEIKPKCRVLDFGSGTGEVTVRAGKITGPGGFVIGVDMSGEMIRMSREKVRRLGMTNVTFAQMNMEALDLPDDSFDRAVGNYSICCCFDYKATLLEIFRVLKRDGKVIYNHNGPGEALEYQLMSKLLEKYRSKNPSVKLSSIREANALLDGAWSLYRDPSAALTLMRNIGFESPEAILAQRSIKYRSAQHYVDRLLQLSWKPEADEMSQKTLRELGREALTLLAPFAKHSGLDIRDEMVFFIGRK